MLQAPPPQARGRVRLTEINPHLVCVLCHGYFIDATTMAECPHSFCRSCIVLYLETKSYCPICEVQIHKTKPHLNLKPDKTLQDIVYKLVPGLFHDEMRRRRAFYAKYPNRDLYLCPEARGAGVERIIYSPEDSVSLSIEYYDEKDDLDRRDAGHLLPNTESYSVRSDREREEWAPTRPGASYEGSSQPQGSQSPTPEYKDGLKRFLQCPAAVTMRLLKKFIRLKFGLSQACTVEILYRRESLPDSYSLMDIAYIYTWKRNGPMRFYYRIHMPTPLRTVMPALKPSSEPIRDTIPRNLKSPELLDAVGLRPKLPEMAPTTLVESESEGIKEVACVKEVEVRPLKEDERLAELEKRPLKVDERPDEVEERPSKVEERPPKMEENPLNVEEKPSKVEETPPKVEERPKITPAEDTAVSLLLALSNGHGVQEPPKEQVVAESKPEPVAATTTVPPPPAVVARSPNANNGVFKVPTSMTKRFVINGGKLVPVKNKQSGGKSNKTGEKTKVNGKTVNGEHSFVNDRFTNPLGLPGTGPLGLSGGRLPPGSPRPPPKSEKAMKTKYMAPSGLLANRLSPEVTLSQNKSQPEVYQPPPISANQPKPIRTQVKPNRPTANGQPAHRKEVNRLEQIVQICLKKETSQKEASERKEAEVRDEAIGEKRSGTLNVEVNAKSDAESEGGARAAHGDASIQPTDHVASPSNTDRVDTETSILKRKLNDTRRVGSFAADPTKRRLVTPDVSIELMANPAKERERKREPSDLSTLTKRFLNDIQRMKKLETELKINKLDHMCASTVKIEKVPAPSSLKVPTPKSSPSGNEKSKAIDGSDFSSENDQLFIDIRNKCEAFKRKNPEPVSVAIERVSEDRTTKSSSNQNSPAKGIDSTTEPKSDASPRPSGTHKKLPRLIEINAPPRPKLSPIVPDLKQKIKMTTVRKEVPIGKEVPLVRRDCNGALDLSSGMSPPSGKQTATGNKSPFHRSSALEKSPTTPSPLLAMSSFPMPDVNRASPIRIPTLKSKTSPTPRPSSLSSSSPSPPAESKDLFPSSAAFQQLYRQQMEFQSRMLASQANNNWSRDPLMAKKLEEWMRIMNIPHQLMFPSQESRK